MDIPWDYIAEGIKFVVKRLDKRKIKKIPIRIFFVQLENKLGSSLSTEYKEKIIEDLEEQGRIIVNRAHNLFVISKPINEVMD
jgi:hypothetical protein